MCLAFHSVETFTLPSLKIQNKSANYYKNCLINIFNCVKLASQKWIVIVPPLITLSSIMAAAFYNNTKKKKKAQLNQLYASCIKSAE